MDTQEREDLRRNTRSYTSQEMYSGSVSNFKKQPNTNAKVRFAETYQFEDLPTRTETESGFKNIKVLEQTGGSSRQSSRNSFNSYRKRLYNQRSSSSSSRKSQRYSPHDML